MANVRVKSRPTGLYNGLPWPERGETLELPDGIAEAMAAAGQVEIVQAEKRVEKRPVPKKGVETRTTDGD